MKSILSASAAFAVAGMLTSPAAFAQMTTPTAPSSANQPSMSEPMSGSSGAMTHQQGWQGSNQPAWSGSRTEAYSAVTPRQEHLRLPSGPYLLSCTNARMSGGMLVATCDDQASARGQAMDTWRTAELPNAEQCNGAIENLNGRLVCGTEPMVGSGTPSQSYGGTFGGSAMTPPYEGENYGSTPAYPPGYSQGQPVAPAVKPMVGSSMPPEYSGSSFGTSNPGYGETGAPAYGAATLPYQAGPGYHQGQPPAPAAKPYYSRPYRPY